MADINQRPYSKNYSGLINQSAIAVCVTGACIIWHEFARRRRRGKPRSESLGSVESWELGYLYQARSWAKHPTPPYTRGWPLSWVTQNFKISENKMVELRGIDATMYTRFLRGCFWFTTLQTFTTFVVLFPVHVRFSDDSASPKSMTRASIASLVLAPGGLNLLWIHVCLLTHATLSWMATLIWIYCGVFRMRVHQIEAASRQANLDVKHHPHPYPHPNWPFPSTSERGQIGLRARTVMVSNVPPTLRSEAELKEYFVFYMTRKVHVPFVGQRTFQPGFLNKFVAFLLNRIRPTPASRHWDPKSVSDLEDQDTSKPVIERVVIVRKMTELASMLERREDVLNRLETAHVNLALRTLNAVKEAIEKRNESASDFNGLSTNMADAGRSAGKLPVQSDPDEGLDLLIHTLSSFRRSRDPSVIVNDPTQLGFDTIDGNDVKKARLSTAQVARAPRSTIWEALLSVPRHYLDPYQPLVRLNVLFRGKTVPAIDYYTTKLKVLTGLIMEYRSKASAEYDAVSTAFVTFADPRDARRACKFLAVHPKDPLLCSVTMAPSGGDLDWILLMKSQFRVEFLKDWVLNIGVWTFTLFWVFPVSGLIGLVSIQNISAFWPSLKNYLKRHPWEEEVIQSLIPTLLVALLVILIPILLYLIAKKAHTIPTLSVMDDTILTRYYKFLIVNVLLFFCVGTAFVQTALKSLRSAGRQQLLHTIATTFPTAGPFYVGWLIFTTATHSGLNLALFGLPLLKYISTRRQVTPRKRALGIRPCTYNYSYWLPNHLLVIHILLLFSILNPLVIPFSMVYFFVESGVVRNQLLHAYAKNYEGNGQLLLIRIIRYSLDGLILTQAVFLGYMIVLEKKANVGVTAVLIIFTAIFKISMTHKCRARFERDDHAETLVVCGIERPVSRTPSKTVEKEINNHPGREWWHMFSTSRRPDWYDPSYTTIRSHAPELRRPNPFRPKSDIAHFSHPNSTLKSCVGKLVVEESKPSSSRTKYTEPKRRTSSKPQSPVVAHPPLMAWDDQTLIDLPYDNPYYTHHIRDELWLPRDPTGLLDLDDTIDMFKAITSDSAAGELRPWLAQTGALAISTSHSKLGPDSLRSLSQKYTGTEQIELPPGIAIRVQTLRGRDVEEANGRRASIWSRKSSGFQRRNTSGVSRLGIGSLRSFFNGDTLFSPDPVTDHVRRSTSLLSNGNRLDRSASDIPDMQGHTGLFHSARSLGDDKGLETTSRVLTTKEALEMEVKAEEAEALGQRLKQEDEASSSRWLWWIPSWLYQSRMPVS